MDRQPLPNAVRRWLRDALPSWQAAGLVAPEQAAGILALYEGEEEAGRRGRSLVSFALSGMGALLFGLAALLLIGFNWEAMPASVKLVTVLAVVAGTHAVGLAMRASAPRLSEVVSFLGCLFYGCGIWLVAQVYNLDAHYPDGVWWWAVGVLPFALLLDSLLLHLLYAVLITVWAGMEIFGFLTVPPWWLFGWGWLPNGAWGLPLLALPGLVWGYRRGSPVAVGLYVAVLTLWVVAQALVWMFGLGPFIIFWVGSIGALLLLMAEAHDEGDAMAIPYRLWGTLITAGILIPMSSWYFWAEIARFIASHDGYLHYRFVGTAAFAFLCLAAVAGWVLGRVARRGAFRRAAFPAALFALMLVGALTVGLLSPDTAALLPTFAANAAMIGLAVYLINVGARDERVRPFGAGVLYFLVWAIARYIDLFQGAGGMLAAAAIFALCGLALFIIARFWGRVSKHQEDIDTPRVQIHPWRAPAWVEGLAAYFGGLTGRALAVTAACQVALLVAMIGYESLPFLLGRTVVVRTRPVDPRDFFRGDYVVLAYDFTNMRVEDEDRGEMWGIPGQPRGVYVTLEPEADGRHWRAVRASHARPKGGVYIVGDYGGPAGLSFGIEQYFVQEGRGLDLERLRNRGNLSVEIVISPWGRAKIKRLIEE